VSVIEEALAPGWAKVYLHCTAGIIRSATVAAAYLIKAQSMTAQESYDLLVEKRDCEPDLEVLRKYEEALLHGL
jgi:protein-tyrosine phosphatase